MTRSASAATLLTLWSTRSTARPSSRNVRIKSEKTLISRRRQAGERLVDQHHFGIARHRFGELHAAQIGERQRPWMPLQNAAQSDLLGDGAGALRRRRLLSQAATASRAAAPA